MAVKDFLQSLQGVNVVLQKLLYFIALAALQSLLDSLTATHLVGDVKAADILKGLTQIVRGRQDIAYDAFLVHHGPKRVVYV